MNQWDENVIPKRTLILLLWKLSSTSQVKRKFSNHESQGRTKLHRFLDQATDGKKVLSDANIDKICDDIKEALHRQFGSKNTRKEFRLRMSNMASLPVSFGLRKTNQRKHYLFLITL